LHHLVQNYTFSARYSSKRSSNSSRRNFSSIAQYRSEATVTVTSSSSKKYGPPPPPNSKTAHHTVTLVLWSGRWWSFRELLWGQYRTFCLLSVLTHYRRTAILNELLHNISAALTRLSHGVKWER
jgi:hypothetical protein